MRVTFDTLSTFAIATLMAGLSVTAFVRTDAGDPLKGWTNGAYQRGFEGRFEASIPANEGAVAIWAAVKWVLFQEPANGAVAGKDGWLFTAEEFTEPSDPRDFSSELARVSRALSKDGITLVPLIVPDKARMQAQRLQRGRSESFTQRYAHTLAAIQNAGLVGIDLRKTLQIDAAFMRTDTHWSPEGARRAANAIAEAVQELEIPRAKVTTLATGVTEFDGDLMSFVATGPFRSRVGPARETIENFETTVATKGGLFGDVAVPVALVGTSFSAKEEFHFEGFLKQALQADVLNLSHVGQGPFVPMDAFLKDRSSFSTLPSLVIWEIPERFLTSRSTQK